MCTVFIWLYPRLECIPFQIPVKVLYITPGLVYSPSLVFIPCTYYPIYIISLLVYCILAPPRIGLYAKFLHNGLVYFWSHFSSICTKTQCTSFTVVQFQVVFMILDHIIWQYCTVIAAYITNIIYSTVFPGL